MNKLNFDAMTRQYQVKEASGKGHAEWPDGLKSKFPMVKMLGAAKQPPLTGKNLFDPSVLLEYGAVVEDDGSYRIDDPDPFYQKKLWSNTDGYEGQITLSLWNKFSTGTGRGCVFHILYSDGTNSRYLFPNGDVLRYNAWLKLTCVSTSGKIVDNIYGSYGSRSTVTWVKDIQVEKSATATEYEPYCGGITIDTPTPETPLVVYGNDSDVVCFRKNELIELFDNCSYGSGTIGRYTATGGSPSLKCYLRPNVTYTITLWVKDANQHAEYGIGPISFWWHNQETGAWDPNSSAGTRPFSVFTKLTDEYMKISYTFTKSFPVDEIALGYYSSGRYIAYDTERVQIEQGDTSTDYEPHYDGGEATAPTLYAVGKHQDEWNPQTGKGVRRCAVIESYGGESITTDYISTTGELTEDAKVVYCIPDTPFETDPAPMTCPTGYGQIAQVGGSIDNCALEVKYLSHRDNNT